MYVEKKYRTADRAVLIILRVVFFLERVFFFELERDERSDDATTNNAQSLASGIIVRRIIDL